MANKYQAYGVMLRCVGTATNAAVLPEFSRDLSTMNEFCKLQYTHMQCILIINTPHRILNNIKCERTRVALCF